MCSLCYVLTLNNSNCPFINYHKNNFVMISVKTFIWKIKTFSRDAHGFFDISKTRLINQNPTFWKTFRCLQKCRFLIGQTSFAKRENLSGSRHFIEKHVWHFKKLVTLERFCKHSLHLTKYHLIYFQWLFFCYFFLLAFYLEEK